MDEHIPKHEAAPKRGDLARASLAELFQLQELSPEHAYIRVSAGGHARGWELLARDFKEDSKALKRAIQQRIRESEAPVTDLVLAFLGQTPWRGRQQLMVHMQYFRRDDPIGDLFGSHVKQASIGGQLEADGSLLVMGTCQNIWIYRRRLLAWLWSLRT
jgi:hypothetical protein